MACTLTGASFGVCMFSRLCSLTLTFSSECELFILFAMCLRFMAFRFNWWMLTLYCSGFGERILGSSGVQFPWFRNEVIIGGFRDSIILLVLPVERDPDADAVRPVLFGGREKIEWDEVVLFCLSVFIFLSFWLQLG